MLMIESNTMRLLVNQNGLITGLLPLDLMKEERLFAGLPGLGKIGFN